MTLINAKIDMPALHCTQQFELGGIAADYLWFAYFFADVTTISTPQPISVFVPLVSNTRALFPDLVGNNQDILIPPEVGTFQVYLDDGGASLALLGVLVVLFSRHETPDGAIAAGYDAFRDAVIRELNNFVKANGAVRPTDDQIAQIANEIRNSVSSAIESKLSTWQKLFDTQDKFIGHFHTLFVGSELAAGPTPRTMPLGLPPLDGDVFVGGFKVGHQHYEFVNPLLTLQQVIAPDPCAAQQEAFAAAAAKLQALRAQLEKLISQLVTAPPGQRKAIQA